MFGVSRTDPGSITERLPAVLVSGLVVGSGFRGFKIGYVVVTILVFALGVFVGWLFGS